MLYLVSFSLSCHFAAAVIDVSYSSFYAFDAYVSNDLCPAFGGLHFVREYVKVFQIPIRFLRAHTSTQMQKEGRCDKIKAWRFIRMDVSPAAKCWCLSHDKQPSLNYGICWKIFERFTSSTGKKVSQDRVALEARGTLAFCIAGTGPNVLGGGLGKFSVLSCAD